MATMVVAGISGWPGVTGVAKNWAVPRRSVRGSRTGWVGVRCVTNGARQAVQLGQSSPAAGSRSIITDGVASHQQERVVGNQAERLLAQFAQLPASDVRRNPETEAVRRLLMWDSLPKKQEVQLFSVYEINEHDRDSPAFLPFSAMNIAKSKPSSGIFGGLQGLVNTLSGDHEHGLGDLVPFTNKIYDSTLQVRLGITAGLTMVVKAYPGKGSRLQKKQQFFFPDRYEAMYTFYLGDMGHVSAQGPFSTFEDTLLTVTGGAGLFREARGVVHLHNVTPFMLFYTFHVRGVPELPKLLTSVPVQPEHVQPCREPVARKPGFSIPTYTN